MELKFTVVDASNEVEAQPKPASTIAIAASKDFEDLEPTDDMFDHNAVTGQGTVVGDIGWGQGMMLAALLGAISPWVELGYALIA